MDNILVAGACGFIGSHFLDLLKEKGYEGKVIAVDALTYAGNLVNIEHLKGELDIEFFHGSITSEHFINHLVASFRPQIVVNFCAESHVDRSISSSKAFVESNFVGVGVLLDACLGYGVSRFCQISTDEVYGDIGRLEGASTEFSLIKPSSPYSATKAAADLLALSYYRTHELDVVITRSSNNYGFRQYPEKLIPLMVKRAMEDGELPVYGDGKQIRDWLHVRDNCQGIYKAMTLGNSGTVYNLSSEESVENIEIVERIMAIVGKGRIKHVKDRKGHDRRYLMSSSFARVNLGWSPKVDFASGLEETVRWYMETDWFQRIAEKKKMEF